MKRMFMAMTVLLGLLLTFANGCGGDNRRGGEGDDAGADSGTGAGDADGDTDADGDSGQSNDDCSEEAKLVYLVGSSNTLYSFHPPDKQFKTVGVIQCPGGGQPFSMSVSRDEVAYVLYWDGASSCVGINAVDIHDASCIGKTAFACNAVNGNTFGMGFATDGPNTKAEKLYIGSNTSPARLAWIDIQTWKVTVIGPLSGTAEMTGNSNGELWGFFAWTTPPHVSQIDKATGQESNTQSFPNLAGNAAFAFAHWGGDYYLFHGPNGNTTVYKLSGGQLTSYMPSTGYDIVGAGVSTCAPFVVQ